MQGSITRLRDSLVGLSVGDAYGQLHFRADFWGRNTLPTPPWFWTDDTEMACALANVIVTYNTVDQDALANQFAKRHNRERGYGPAMIFDLLPRLARGDHWSDAAKSLFEGTGSFGNGAAMRVAPLGAYFADDLQRIVVEAEKSAVVTHAHSDAVDGAIAVAVGAALFASKADFNGPRGFFDLVMQHLSDGPVRRVMQNGLDDLTIKTDVAEVARLLGNGSRISAVDTVPYCLWMAARNRDSFERAILETVSVGGDMDTTAAIVGGIIAAQHGVSVIPREWLDGREPLPRWLSDELEMDVAQSDTKNSTGSNDSGT